MLTILTSQPARVLTVLMTLACLVPKAFEGADNIHGPDEPVVSNPEDTDDADAEDTMGCGDNSFGNATDDVYSRDKPAVLKLGA